jgi:hypothetical protein
VRALRCSGLAQYAQQESPGAARWLALAEYRPNRLVALAGPAANAAAWEIPSHRFDRACGLRPPLFGAAMPLRTGGARGWQRAQLGPRPAS